MDIPEFGDHRCAECADKGHCSMETSARYLGANPTKGAELKEITNELGEEYLNTLKTDAIISGHPTEFLVAIAFATGYALACGAEMVKCSPSETRHKMAEIVATLGLMKHKEE